jgi:hypothetical protein
LSPESAIRGEPDCNIPGDANDSNELEIRSRVNEARAEKRRTAAGQQSRRQNVTGSDCVIDGGLIETL